MSLFQTMNISGSALTANRLRMDVVSSNIANANSTRAEFVDGEWMPYRRKITQLQPVGESDFRQALSRASEKQAGTNPGQGVKVSAIREDWSPFQLLYDPDHPDANEDGYVQLPNVDMTKEMVDLTSATRSYEANVTSMNAAKNMYLKALEIGQ